MSPRSISRRVYPANMVAHLRSLAAERPGDTALIAVHQTGDVATDKKMDYQVLDLQVRALAACLQDRFAAGERALLLLDNDEHYVVSFLACLYAGLVAVPVFPPESVRERHLARLLAIAADAEAHCILTTGQIAPLIRATGEAQLAQAAILAVDEIKIEAASAWREHIPHRDDIAFLQYTSGSTSTPKGVMVSHGNLMVNAKAFEEGMSISADDIFVSWLPLYHDMGLIGGLLQPIHRGVPVILMTPGFFIERPVRWLEAISRYRATVSGAPNFAFQLCVDRVREGQMQGLDLSSWRVAFSGAEPVRRETMRAFTERFASAGFSAGTIYPCYGLAEATLFVTGGTRGDGLEGHRFSARLLAQGRAEVADASGAAGPGGRTEDARSSTSLVACGIPASGHSVVIVDPDTFTRLADGFVGEIWTDGPSLAQGYWRRFRETEQTFVSHEGGRWLRTGDLGFIHDRQLYIAGRHKDLIIIRGQNVYPQDIEQAVEEEVEAVRKGRVAAFSIEMEPGPDYPEGGGEGIGMAVEISRSMQKLIPADTLAKALSEAVSAICHEPLSVVILLNPGALPKTSSGKLQRAACRRGWQDRTLDAYAIYEFGRQVFGEGEQPLQPQPAKMDEVEAALSSIWETLLQRTGMGGDDHFFASGGNSLAAVQAAALIADRWQIEFPVRSLFEHPRLRDCASEIRRLSSPGASRRRADARLMPLVPITPLSPSALPELTVPPSSPVDERAASMMPASFPLSFSQQRLWFLWQLDPSSTAYHIKHGLRISGALDGEGLRTAFQGLIGRHASLRTVFRPGADGSVEQIILPVLPFEIVSVDLRHVASTEREAKAVEAADRTISTPFDLTRGPLLRVALIRIAEDECILAMVLHHIIADGVSMQLLTDELAARYRAAVRGEALAAQYHDPLPLQYTDYAAWQRNWLAAGEKDRQLAYWQDALGNEHPVMALSSDHPRQPVANYRAARRSFDLPRDVLTGLRRLAGERNATLFMALLTGFSALLHRYTGQEDIRVGVPVANRNHVGTAGVIGFFVNTQVLRARVHGRMALSTVLDQMREAAIDAQANQDLPFEQLVEVLQPERSLSHSPLFQVTINHLLRDERALHQLPGLRLADYPLGEQAAQFELTLETVEYPDGGVGASFIYAAELFDTLTVERLGWHYVRMLRTLAENPAEAVGDIPLLTESEVSQLAAWGHPEPQAQVIRPVHRLIEQQARECPDAPAIIFDSASLTYAELNRRANRLAHRLILLGVQQEVRVGVSMERSLEMIVGLLAVLKAGGAYVPLDPEYPRERLHHMMEDSGIGLLLTQSHIRPNIPQMDGLSVLDLDTFDSGKGAETDPDVSVHDENLAYVIYTSGSTGRPKGVAVAHGSLSMHVDAIMRIYDVRRGDRELMFFSMNFDAAGEQWMGPLCGGAAIVLSSVHGLESGHFARLITSHAVTTLHLPPAYLRLLLPLIKGGGGSVRTCIAGGEAWFSSDLAAARSTFPHGRLINAYGPTEAVITPAAWTAPAEGSVFQGEYAPIGRPVGERILHVLDGDLNPVPPGAAGELYIGGSGLARGYLHRAALTGERFVADPFSENGRRLYRTGDRVRWRPDGQLEYLGRLDHQIKVRGFRVELGEIEAQLLNQPGIRDAVVIAQENRNGTRLIAYVAAHAGILLNPVMLKAALSTVLPDYMLPNSLVFMDALPATPNGKIDRKALTLPEQTVEHDYEAPVSQLEAAIAEIWSDVLDVPQVGLHSNFFDLGGHSLLLIKVQYRLQEQLNLRITIIDLFRHTTVAALASFVGEAKTEVACLQRHQARAQRQRGTFIQRGQRAGRTN